MWLFQRIKIYNLLLLSFWVSIAVERCSALPTMSYWYPVSIKSHLEMTQVPIKKKKKSWFRSIVDTVTSGNNVTPGPKFLHHTLYWFTAADAIQSVLRDQYTDLLGTVTTRRMENKVVPVVYSKLFYFARLGPRLLYAVGALLRALQCCTPLERILDPTIGVGAGINMCAMIATSRWIKPLILGWATTKCIWKWLGAQRVQRAYLPITLSIREWEDQKTHKRRSKTEEDES